LIEVAALNQTAPSAGHYSARELNDRLIQKMSAIPAGPDRNFSSPFANFFTVTSRSFSHEG